MWSIYADRGYARHMYYLTPPQLVDAFELKTISRSLCVFSIGFGKMSVAVLIERIAPPDSKRKWLLRGISSSIAITGFITFVLFHAQCRPVQAVWDKSLILKGLGSCLDLKAINTWNMFIASKSSVLALSFDTCSDLVPLRLLVFSGLRTGRHPHRFGLEATNGEKEGLFVWSLEIRRLVGSCSS